MGKEANAPDCTANSTRYRSSFECMAMLAAWRHRRPAENSRTLCTTTLLREPRRLSEAAPRAEARRESAVARTGEAACTKVPPARLTLRALKRGWARLPQPHARRSSLRCSAQPASAWSLCHSAHHFCQTARARCVTTEAVATRPPPGHHTTPHSRLLYSPAPHPFEICQLTRGNAQGP